MFSHSFSKVKMCVWSEGERQLEGGANSEPEGVAGEREWRRDRRAGGPGREVAGRAGTGGCHLEAGGQGGGVAGPVPAGLRGKGFTQAPARSHDGPTADGDELASARALLAAQRPANRGRVPRARCVPRGARAGDRPDCPPRARRRPPCRSHPGRARARRQQGTQ